MDIRGPKAPHTDPGVRSDAGLLFQGWSRDGRWVGGCLFNERGEIIFGTPSKWTLEAEIIAAQSDSFGWRPTALQTRQEAQGTTQPYPGYHIPLFEEL